jgi:o-succinylbenzoate---CoA ligase
MRRSGTITALPTQNLSSAAALEALRHALTGQEAVAFLDRDHSVAGLDPGESALVLFTSGSTGLPKAVGLSAPALVASATASLTRLHAPAKASWSLLLPLHHIAGVQVLLRALINGGAVGSIDDQVDFTSIVPTQLQRALHGDDSLKVHLQGCRAVLVGGAALPDALKREAKTAGINVVTTYGMTETAGGCVYDGIPLDGVEIGFDPEGQINITGPMIALGYLNDRDESARLFRGGTFQTMDVGVMKDGRLDVSGRSDAVINSGGEKISLEAVETTLREHPMVIDAIATGAPDEVWGERLIVGVIASGTVHLDQLRDFVSERLGRVNAPRSLIFLHEIPKTSLGKPHRSALLSLTIDEDFA